MLRSNTSIALPTIQAAAKRHQCRKNRTRRRPSPAQKRFAKPGKRFGRPHLKSRRDAPNFGKRRYRIRKSPQQGKRAERNFSQTEQKNDKEPFFAALEKGIQKLKTQDNIE